MRKTIDRVIGLILHPNRTWDEIHAEQATEAGIIRNFVVYVAAIPAISGLLGSLSLHFTFLSSMKWAVVFYLFAILGIWFSAEVLHILAVQFKCESNRVQFLKLTSAAFAGIFVGFVFFIVPAISGLSILGVYGFYVFWIGFPRLVHCPEEANFTFSIIGLIVLALVLAALFLFSALVSQTLVPFLRL
ncbi:MAG: YIP1 family protein [Candidatus Zhuqueibacterota bacterium]